MLSSRHPAAARASECAVGYPDAATGGQSPSDSSLPRSSPALGGGAGVAHRAAASPRPRAAAPRAARRALLSYRQRSNSDLSERRLDRDAGFRGCPGDRRRHSSVGGALIGTAFGGNCGHDTAGHRPDRGADPSVRTHPRARRAAEGGREARVMTKARRKPAPSFVKGER